MPRSREPKAVLQARGSTMCKPSKGRHLDDLPAPAVIPISGDRCGADHQPPEWLDDVAREEWVRVICSLRGMGLLTTADHSVIAGMCSCWSAFVRASRAMADADPADLRPLQATANEAFTQYLKCADRFALNPVARTKVHATDEAKKFTTPKARFFGRAV